MPAPIINQIPKTVPGQFEAASNLTDDGVVLTYSNIPLMPVIQYFQTSDSSPLALGSSTFTDTPVTIYLPIGTYFVRGSLSCTAPASGATNYGAKVTLGTTGTIAELGSSVFTFVSGETGGTTTYYGPLIGTSLVSVLDASTYTFPDISLKFETKMTVTVGGYLTMQVAQVNTNSPSAGVYANQGSYLIATRVA